MNTLSVVVSSWFLRAQSLMSAWDMSIRSTVDVQELRMERSRCCVLCNNERNWRKIKHDIRLCSLGMTNAVKKEQSENKIACLSDAAVCQA